MRTYNPAFDLYHSIYRMAHIAAKLDGGENLEVDKARIWDFYLLFPDKVYSIHLHKNEEKIKELRNTITRQNNPYDYHGDNTGTFDYNTYHLSFVIDGLNRTMVADSLRLGLELDDSGRLTYFGGKTTLRQTR